MGVFPADDLDRVLQLAFGADVDADPSTWTWTDLTTRLLPEDITIRQGVAVGAAAPQTSLATVVVTNDDGALTPDLPTSPYWPNVDLGTPARLLARSQTDLVDTFTRTAETNGWGTSTSGDRWTPAAGASAFSTTGTTARLAVGGIFTYQCRSTRRFSDVDLVYDVSTAAVASGVEIETGSYLRSSGGGLYALYCTASFDTTGAIILRAYTQYNGGPLTMIGNVFAPSLTYSAGTNIRVRMRAVGPRVQVRAWLASGAEPSTWPLDTTQTGTIVTGFDAPYSATDVLSLTVVMFAGNTNTVPFNITFDNVTASEVYSPRIEGYLSDIRPTYLPAGGGVTYSTVQLDISGIGSLLDKREAPSYSPLRRSLQLADQPPVAYWPLEDEETAQSGASALLGQQPMAVTGPAVFAFSTDTPTALYLARFGTKPMVSVAAGASLTGLVPRSSVQTEWAVSCVLQCYVPDVPVITEMRILEWETRGSALNRWALVETNTGYQVRAYNDVAGTSTNVVTYAPGLPFSKQNFYAVEAIQNGANIDVTLFVNDVTLASGSVAGTLAALNGRITVNPDRTNTTASVTPAGIRFIVGHVRVIDETSVADLPHYTDPDTGLVPYASNAWYLESSHRRAKRLCDEARIPATIIGSPGLKGMTQLNAQGDGATADLLRSAIESESGALLYEAGFGYAILPRSVRYNLVATLVVNMATYVYADDTDAGDVLVPRLDATSANYWTVQRANGSAGSYAAPAAYRARRGTIGAQVTVDILRDEDLASHAAWRTHLAVDARGGRFPDFVVDMAGNPDLLLAWLGSRIGSRVKRTNQPTIAGLGVIDQIIEGYSETLGPRTWTTTINGTPAKVWDVAVADQVLGKADTDGSTIRAASSSTPTLLVDVTAGPRWTTDPAQMPIPITAATGEDMIVTAISGTSNPQTFTVTRGVNAKTIPAGTPVLLTTPARAAL